MRWVMLMGLLLSTVASADQSPQHVSKVVKRNLGQIRVCFERNPGQFDKRVTVTFVIDNAGRVTSSTASGEGDKPLQDCIAGVFKRMTFPAGKGVTKVNYPVHIIVANQ